MSFFSDLGDTIKSTTQDVADKTKTATDVVKLQNEKRQKEDLIKKKYTEIGEKYYDANKDDAPGEFTDLFKEVADAFARIDELNDEIAEKKGSNVCPKCGEFVDKKAAFCPSCGAKLDIFEDEDDVEAATTEEETTED